MKLRKKRKWLLLPLLLAALIALSSLLMGNVYFSKENGGDSNTVFIAGNPDLYPLEYYNEKTGEYEGVLPDIFRAISEDSGIDFTYVYAGMANHQVTLAKNNQVDVLSAMVVGKVPSEYLSGSVLLLTFTIEGQSYEAHIGFTAVCEESVRSAIIGYLSNLPEDTLTDMAISYVMENPDSTAVPAIVWWLIGSVVFLLLVVIVILSAVNSKLRDQHTEGMMYESKTGLYNQDYILKSLTKLVPIHSQEIYYLAYISVNKEKLLRYYGKETAEAVAKYVADVLRESCGEREYCARLGDVAFAFVFCCESYSLAEERVKSLMERLNVENSHKNEDYGMHVRAGVHALQFRLPEGQSPFEISQEAFEWAENHGADYCFSSDELVRARSRKMMLQKETAKAVRKGEILYYLQYVVNAKTGEVAGAEAISRWQHPREGLLMPGEYLSLMQQAQTVHLLDYYMFEKSCQQLEIWRKSGLTDFFLSCNFDRSTLSQEDFFQKISDIAKKYDIDKSKMILEITEDALESDKDVAHRNTLLCVQEGYRIALDDFGNGFSSFKNLLEFNVSHMKLDRSFIAQIASERGRVLLRGLVAAVQRAGIMVIFEGVETAQQRDEVAGLGVDYVQGFYYSRVIPQIEGNRILELIKARLRGEDLRSELRKTYDGYDEDEDVEEETIFDTERNAWIRVRYRWSFLARLHRAPKQIAGYYTQLKNELLSYRKLKSRISWAFDSINFGRRQIAKFVMKQKSLMVYLALDPNEYVDTKYFFKDMSHRKKYARVPMRIKVKSDRAVKYVLELIAAMAEKYSFKRLKERNDKDYSLAFLGVEELIELGLIKVNESVMDELEQIKRKALQEAAFTQAVITQREEDVVARQKAAELRATEPQLVAPAEEAQAVTPAEPMAVTATEEAQTEEIAAEDGSMEEMNTEEINRENKTMEQQNVLTAIEKVEVNYRWSFTARLHKAPKDIAAYYTQIKNSFLQYRKVKSRISWGCDTINYGREPLAKIVMAQKAVYVYLALDPKEYENSKYFFKDFSDKKKFEKVPMRIKVRSERGVRYVCELIEAMAEKYELKPLKTFVAVDYALPDMKFEKLLEIGLVKRIERKQGAAVEEDSFDEALEEIAVVDEELMKEAMQEPISEETILPIVEPLVTMVPVVEELTPEVQVAEEPAPAEPIVEQPAIQPEPETAAPAEEPKVVLEQSLSSGTIEDIEAEEIHVQFLERLCKQFDADEINAHVKVVYKKKNEKKTSIFDILMKRNK